MKVIVTGGAGFIGNNAVRRYQRRGWEVVAMDNLSRPGATENVAWLRTHGDLEFAEIDVRDSLGVTKLFQKHADADLVLHFAAQVAVTTSVANPRIDFETNALGTLNVLEAVRATGINMPFVFSSTNKVYGGLDDVRVIESSMQYRYAEHPFGISEARGLDFHSPYGCSKGAADQYVHDYHRIYGLKTVVFRQSCVYGTRQFGLEDQGWIAWFTLAHELGLPITIYGDGKQMRDVLFIEDFLDAVDGAVSNIDRTAGGVFNIGGGAASVLSLMELISFLGELTGKRVSYLRAPWRPGDQRVYVSDIRRAEAEFGWRPTTKWRKGVTILHEWIRANRDLCAIVISGRPNLSALTLTAQE